MSYCYCENIIQRLLFVLPLFVCGAAALVSGDDYMTFHQNFAVINITYSNAAADMLSSEIDDQGHYGISSRVISESGYLNHVKSLGPDIASSACIVPLTITSADKWIAIIERTTKENCKLPRLLSSATLRNASAVVIYGNDEITETELQGKKNKDEVVHVFISQQFGEHIVSLLNNGTRVHMQISLGRHQTTYYNTINRTSMLFLSISFIVLMIITLAWLVFYYVQRSRYTYAKQRLSKRLMCAAKKAISKMPLRTVRSGEDEIDAGFDLCAVCIEGYKSSDVVRILPCKHIFHKVCIDPWLIEHRTCPICKIDILKAYGLQVHRSRESIVNVEPDVASTSYGYSEFVSPDGGIIGRDFDSDGVEIVRFQLAHVEYHNSPSSTAAVEVLLNPSHRAEECTGSRVVAPTSFGNCTTVLVENCQHDVIDDPEIDSRRMSSDGADQGTEITGQASSIQSSKSDESEANETHSLMAAH